MNGRGEVTGADLGPERDSKHGIVLEVTVLGLELGARGDDDGVDLISTLRRWDELGPSSGRSRTDRVYDHVVSRCYLHPHLTQSQ